MRVVVVTRDLMDGSRFRALGAEVRVARRPDDPELTAADLVVVDLAGRFDLEALVGLGPPVLAYGSHVDTAALDAARAAGCVDAVPRSVVVRRVASALDGEG